MGGMRGRTLRAALVLAFIASCAPALPISAPTPTNVPSAAAIPTRIETTDRVTIHTGGPGGGLEVRSAADGTVVRQLPDAALLPDKRTLITLDRELSGITLRILDRMTGERGRSLSIPGSWSFRLGAAGPAALSGNGRWLGLVGSAYNSTDATGKWVAHSTFAVVDTALGSAARVVELDGGYFIDGVSNDGRSLYLIEDLPIDRPVPTSSTLRGYDIASGQLFEISGDPPPQMNGFRTDPVRTGAAAYSLVVFGQDAPYLVRLDADARSTRVLRIPTATAPTPSSPNVPPGELALLWSLAATRDGRTIYAVNTAVGLVNQIDTATFTVRRTGRVSAVPHGSVLDALGRWLAPVADAKMIVHAGALLSADEKTLYAVAENGIRAIDTGTLEARTLVATDAVMDLALSPDGRRLYALSAAGRWMIAYDASTGARLGQIDVGAYPQAIVAVDAQ
jgi:hypothetical protein